MEKTQHRKLFDKDFGPLEGEFVQTEEGWFCREVNGVKWNFADWGAPAAMETPEEAAVYLLSLDVEET